MKLVEIKEDYFKELCRNIFKRGMKLLKKQPRGTVYDEMSVMMGCENITQFRIILNDGYEASNSNELEFADVQGFVDTSYEYKKLDVFFRKSKPESIDEYEKDGYSLTTYELDNIVIGKISYIDFDDHGLFNWDAYCVCEDSLK